MAKRRIPESLQAWIDARKRHHLSHAQVQMARELGLNPKRLGRIDNADQAPWKLPLPQYIEELYLRSFGRDQPEVVRSIEEKVTLEARKKAEKREAKARRRAAGEAEASVPPTES